MVQVDVFWSYGIGASMALAAGRQLVARRAIAGAGDGGAAPERLPGDPQDRASLWRNPFFLATVHGHGADAGGVAPQGHGRERHDH